MTTHFVAIEGPCCAGKTTLAKAVLGCLADLAVTYVQCYADHVGGGRFLPAPIPVSLAEDQAGVEALLEIEADGWPLRGPGTTIWRCSTGASTPCSPTATPSTNSLDWDATNPPPERSACRRWRAGQTS